MQDFEQVEVTSRKNWRAWLQDNHAQTKSIWFVTYSATPAGGSIKGGLVEEGDRHK